jgi:MYXO-CTERM domain-containing protein
MNTSRTVAAAIAAAITVPAFADYTITQGTTAPTYGTTLNFDEPGGPTGFVSTDAWLVSHGITELQAGDGVPQVDDWATITGQPWIGSGNSFFGNFGVFLTFENDVTEMSFEAWDPSGPPGPFGGGMGIFLFNDGVEVGSAFVEPARAGIGDQAFDVTTSGGDVFDEIRILGFGFTPTTYIDNMSWNPVPAPGALALLGVVGLVGGRRRRK